MSLPSPLCARLAPSEGVKRAQSALMALLLVFLGACTGSRAGSDRPTVVATVYPLAFLVEKIGGERVDLVDLTPAGVEPHDVELEPGQIRALAEADLTLYLGGGFQPAVEDVLPDVSGVTLDLLAPIDAGADPHAWLDPRMFGRMAEATLGSLVDIDPEGAASYEAAAATLERDLDALDDDFAAGLAQCDRRTIVTSHAAFGYLAARYDLDEVALSGLDPEAEPSPQRLAEVARLAEAEGVTTIFSEELVSPEVAESLADELGIEVAVLDPLETRPGDGDYEDAMRSNLATLQEALDCA